MKPEEELIRWFGGENHFKILQYWKGDFDTHYYVISDTIETIYFIRIFKTGDAYSLSQDNIMCVEEAKGA